MCKSKMRGWLFLLSYQLGRILPGRDSNPGQAFRASKHISSVRQGLRTGPPLSPSARRAPAHTRNDSPLVKAGVSSSCPWLPPGTSTKHRCRCAPRSCSPRSAGVRARPRDRLASRPEREAGLAARVQLPSSRSGCEGNGVRTTGGRSVATPSCARRLDVAAGVVRAATRRACVPRPRTQSRLP